MDKFIRQAQIHRDKNQIDKEQQKISDKYKKNEINVHDTVVPHLKGEEDVSQRHKT